MSHTFSWVPRQVGPIGLDLGTRVVRMLQLTRHKGQVSIVACAQREIPPDTASDEELELHQVQAVEEMLRFGGFRGKSVITAVPWDDLHVRTVRLPSMPDESIQNAVRFEAADRFGLDHNQTEVRFLVAGDVRQGTELRQEIILLAARRPAVEAHLRKLTRMGLRPAAVDAGPCALFRGFERLLRRDEDAGQTSAFVEIGYRASRVVIARGPELTLIKSIPVGGRRFDELVAEKLELGLAEAAQLRIRLQDLYIAELTGQAGRIPPDEQISHEMRHTLLDALRPALDHLAKEVSLCLRYCSITFRGPRSDSVTVLGGEACNPDMIQLLSDQANVPFHIGKPMRNVTIERGCDGADRRTGQPEWAMALGLALKPVQQALAVAS
ncbi:MAG TPA: pilus assembly protein PilM [Phycisphaerae bacterium]|nr:pilus assembly protein PilM [Phycisphaerae bacterium]HRY69884.1 pilus assembly protein PilM [Phycisphaerae bacterium]HSA25389.1 pilus assembly protein PilM [Phycisphaerae bacterium]